VASETVEAVAFSQAVRAVDAQTTALESLRTRAATILSAAALVTAFLGGLALAAPTLQNGEVQRAELTVWSWLGISARQIGRRIRTDGASVRTTELPAAVAWTAWAS
jgi:hypothetical protein